VQQSKGLSTFEKKRKSGTLVTRLTTNVETIINAGIKPTLAAIPASTTYSAAKMPTFTRSRTKVLEDFLPVVLMPLIKASN
jgi:hypothetical protein